MSGGPYGRGKAPERACMKIEDWPEVDRHIFENACRPSNPFDENSGKFSGFRSRSKVKIKNGYGRFLTQLQFNDPVALKEPPERRITPERIKSYMKRLQEIGNGTQTQLCRLQELGEMAKVLDPTADWSFINRLASRIRAKNVPVRAKSNLRPSDDLLELGFELIAHARLINGCKAAVMFRDGLIIAFLALVPLRRHNLAGFKMGHNLIDLSQTLLVVFDGSETKTHAPLEVEWPECLIGPLEEYLSTYRPFLQSKHGRWHKPADDFLWLSQDGSPMTQMAIYDRIRERTKVKFGTAINPHLFRDAAATTMAITDPAHVRLAAPLLGHRTFSTTEKYYQQAKAYKAHQAYVDALYGRENDDDK